jgi:hypothetical protein
MFGLMFKQLIKLFTVKTYKYPIIKLEHNQIFVFGSNTQGRHGKGAALWAMQNANAIYGKASGLQGRSYAIITKDLTKKIHPSIAPLQILEQISELYKYAIEHPKLEFLIVYRDAPNLNGYHPRTMAVFFKSKLFTGYNIPTNIIFEESFAKLITSL